VTQQPGEVSSTTLNELPAGAKPIEFDPMVQLGKTGLRQYTGFVLEDFLPNLRGQKAAEAYREILESSAIVGGIYRLIQLTMRQIKRYVEPFEDKPDDVARAQRTERALDDMSYTWEDTLSEMASMLIYGYAPMELCYKKCVGPIRNRPGMSSNYDDGVIAWRKFSLRAQDTLFKWVFDQEGEVVAMVQIPPPDNQIITIPIEKLALFRPSVEKENPEGKSILRSGYVNWILVKRLTEIEAIAAERYATGVPVAYMPAQNMQPGAPQNAKNVFAQMKKIVKSVRMDEQAGIVMPLAYDPLTKNPLFKLELLSVNGRPFDYDVPIKRHEIRLGMSMLGDVMMLGHDQVGSFALAKDKRTMLAAGIAAWLDSIYAVINRHVVPRMWALNGWPLDRLCKFGHGEVGETDVKELAQALLWLSQAGMALFPDEKLEDHIRAEAGWPRASHDHEDVPEVTTDNGEEGDEQGAGQVDPSSAAGAGAGGGRTGAPGGFGPRANQAAAGKGARRNVVKRGNARDRFSKYRSEQPRHRTGRFDAPGAKDVAGALSVLRDRQSVGTNDEVAHGFRVANPAPFDPKAMMETLQLEQAPVRRVPMKHIVATQPTVRREGVRRFLENPAMVMPGQRSLTGQLVDRPIAVAHEGKFYLADGHHRLAAQRLLGMQDALIRVVDSATYGSGETSDVV